MDVASNWPEAKVVPRIAGLLFTQYLGYDVEYVPAPGGTSQMYSMLADGEGDVGFVLWPANFESPGQARYNATNKKDPASDSDYAVRSMGMLGYKARSGWYVTTVLSLKSSATRPRRHYTFRACKSS